MSHLAAVGYLMVILTSLPDLQTHLAPSSLPQTPFIFIHLPGTQTQGCYYLAQESLILGSDKGSPLDQTLVRLPYALFVMRLQP